MVLSTRAMRHREYDALSEDCIFKCWKLPAHSTLSHCVLLFLRAHICQSELLQILTLQMHSHGLPTTLRENFEVCYANCHRPSAAVVYGNIIWQFWFEEEGKASGNFWLMMMSDLMGSGKKSQKILYDFDPSQQRQNCFCTTTKSVARTALT